MKQPQNMQNIKHTNVHFKLINQSNKSKLFPVKRIGSVPLKYNNNISVGFQNKIGSSQMSQSIELISQGQPDLSSIQNSSKINKSNLYYVILRQNYNRREGK